MPDEGKHVASETMANLPMFILDVLRHDVVEQLSGIINMMNDPECIGWREFWPHDFTADEVWPELSRLSRDGYVNALKEQPPTYDLGRIDPKTIGSLTDSEDLWFELTDAGRRIWEQWRPPQDAA